MGNMELRRILDANANRSREGIRVVEELGRFVLDDAALTRKLKGVRHDLDSALRELEKKAGGKLLLNRDSEHDVGAATTLISERKRTDLLDIASANFKRIQESLRVLEEFSKLFHAGASDAFKALRFKIYSLEKEMHLSLARASSKRILGKEKK